MSPAEFKKMQCCPVEINLGSRAPPLGTTSLQWANPSDHPPVCESVRWGVGEGFRGRPKPCRFTRPPIGFQGSNGPPMPTNLSSSSHHQIFFHVATACWNVIRVHYAACGAQPAVARAHLLTSCGRR